MKQHISFLLNIVLISFILVVVIFLISTLFAKDRLPSFLNYSIFVVETGSMEPELSPGDMIFVKRTELFTVDDIITYEISPNTFVTHRIIDIVNQEGSQKYETKGDANNTSDDQLVTSDQIVGKLQFSLPRIGKFFHLLKRPFSLFILSFSILLIFFLNKYTQLILNKIKKTKGDE